jgi:hypothetical protein
MLARIYIQSQVFPRMHYFTSKHCYMFGEAYVKAKLIITKGSCWRIGNGQNVNIWYGAKLVFIYKIFIFYYD